MSGNQVIRDKLLVRYKNEMFDLTQFAHKHPGGKNTLNAVHNSDIDFKFETAIPHSPAAKYLLKEYRVSNTSQMNNNYIDDNKDNKCKNCEWPNQQQNNLNDTLEHTTNERDIIDHLIETDDSMEVN